MPIDDALEELKVPKIPETLKELQEKYHADFEISKDEFNINWLNITMKDNGITSILEYSYNMNHPKKIALTERDRCMTLYDSKNNIIQAIKYKSEQGFWQYIFNDEVYHTHSVDEQVKETLEEWFELNENLFLKCIPELEKFVENYDAN
jgi:hypothetical protein